MTKVLFSLTSEQQISSYPISGPRNPKGPAMKSKLMEFVQQHLPLFGDIRNQEIPPLDEKTLDQAAAALAEANRKAAK